jgi:alkanesulfonate monooxygenase SsuD/methylene tetrahydromethanopterin reductase-like flavin-dependent oxidoreductase (luciferase family)
MGVVLPYYHPARVVEEIGMLDHLTGGRLEIGTAIGVPQELSRLNLTMAEARERNDEIVAFLDAALTNRIVSHRGKYFSFSNLRLLPRPLQQPFPPRWTTVISAESARRAARRRVKISTGFNATQLIKRIFDAYREEANTLGFEAGPEYFALRRRVTVAPTTNQARVYAHAVTERLRSFVAEDERLSTQAPDAPAPSGGFTLSDDEFIYRHAQGGCTNHHRAVPSRRRWTFPHCAQLECAGRRSGPSSRAVWSRGHTLTAESVNTRHGRRFHRIRS